MCNFLTIFVLYVQLMNTIHRMSFNLMDLQAKRDLELLSAFELNPDISQRSLSKKLGVALGLTNLYIKRLAHKGYIKISTIPSSRIKYLLTPRGMAEKSRLTYQYMQYSLTYYQDIRQRFKRELSRLANTGMKKVVVYGTGELAELTYLSLREMDFILVGFVTDQTHTTFLSYPVWPLKELMNWEFDSVLITEMDSSSEAREKLIGLGVLEEKVVFLLPQG